MAFFVITDTLVIFPYLSWEIFLLEKRAMTSFGFYKEVEYHEENQPLLLDKTVSNLLKEQHYIELFEHPSHHYIHLLLIIL